ncbi:thiamine transport system ATP-binding protein [Thiothrix eikelboomii]|uniref:Thiamine transport system ATP-binding protein n=1 Tax=Thiothrix eikelboomii TaxID=92487 RepID=A0A1T4WTC2_9GAMM|nr:ATP-binding cassette domain-containing protein [Thiothrix eikelboomii]SKA80613.1 thiamine transport system ATP-binding protein [Thiothrix eikelboomii]
MLVIQNLVLRRGSWQRRYDLQAESAAIMTIQGRSGAGKSALLAAIAGFEPVAAGDIQWQGQSLLSLPIEQRPVSMLFQEHNLFEHLSVAQNLKLGLKFASEATQQTALQQAAEALEITAYLRKMPQELSGGQRQRVALLRTILRPEPIILLDEPFAELDAYTREIAAQWVRATAKAAHKTVLLVTHQNEDVERLADHNVIFE